MTDLGTTFRALSDDTRMDILTRLRTGEMRLSELAEPFSMSQTAVSKHVAVLSDAGLVKVEKRGRTRYCRLDAAALRPAAQWLSEYEEFWDQQVTNLATFLGGDEQ